MFKNATLPVDVETLDQYSSGTLYNYAGYVMIDSEIIEFSAGTFDWPAEFKKNLCKNDASYFW